ncbi:2Fe-2S iron-sulfur cluster-binding protein [Candidatus Poriferisocius sp.]|uniref:(2Fe-2S)-binding protein n=1 Tax=Candidatus Poriferisocius sp. TaxID=3101276 RepID=UPI003B027055
MEFTVDGRPVEIPDDGASLMEVLRDRLGISSVKDGCSPQGQCGCCTVWVDGQPRVSCVTPARRVAGRVITTLDGLSSEIRDAWSGAFCAAGASQCGFCTPGIIMRLSGLETRAGGEQSRSKAASALAAHLCRCTGWQTILEAWEAYGTADCGERDLVVAARSGERDLVAAADCGERDLVAAAHRAEIEGGWPQAVGSAVALGEGGFAADTAPAGALVALPDGRGGWALGETMVEARAGAGKVQGRRTPVESPMPLTFPEGDWAVRLRTSWVDPAYLETDASWCEPGGEPATPLANGGAFGGKLMSPLPEVARRLANESGRPVRVLWSREDSVRHGPKRPPVAIGMNPERRGVIRVARTPGVAGAITAVAPGLVVEEVDIAGPPTSVAIRGAGWVEALVALSALDGGIQPVVAPGGGSARAEWGPEGLRIWVDCGDPLDEVVLRSYCIGAAHMAYSWVTSESLTVDPTGEVHDLTMRSFGIVPASRMPPVEVEINPCDGPPVGCSDAVFAAVAAATWRAAGHPPDWPTGPLPDHFVSL